MLETKHLKDQLHRLYEGEVWHGPSIKEVLATVSLSIATARITPQSKNIAEYLQHLINWRTFALEKMTGGDSFDIILNSEADWSTINDLDQTQWDELVGNYEESQTELLEVLGTYSDRKLEATVPGRKYSFAMLIDGIIHHDIYHSGQMMLIQKLVG